MVKQKGIALKLLIVLLGAAGLLFSVNVSAQSDPVQSNSLGLEGTISAPPPQVGATISFPTNGQTITELPLTVTGICSGDVLVKLFKNGVFTGSAQCTDGNFSIVIDLFDGANELVARVYDALDQEGPASNVVTVIFEETGFVAGPRVTLTSNFAKRGANPGETLTWPIALSGGTGPYALSIDWGDGSSPDLMSRPFPGSFDINHVYKSAGVYNIVIKVTDANNVSAFLQLVGVANGPIAQSTEETKDKEPIVITRIIWWPAAVALPFLLVAFWLGKRYELHVLRRRF